MNKGILIIGFILIALTGILAFVYFKYELPKKEEAVKPMASLNIMADYNDENVEVGYKLYVNNQFIKEGRTIKGGSVQEQIPVNSSVKIMTFNDNNQSYYSSMQELLLSEEKAYRLEFNLVNPQNLSFSYIMNYDIINISVFTNTSFNMPIYCLKWSDNILYVRSHHSTASVPERYKNEFLKCYNLNSFEKNVIINIPLEIRQWSYGVDDKVDIIFIDRDYINNQWATEEDGLDVGASDQRFIININKL